MFKPWILIGLDGVQKLYFQAASWLADGLWVVIWLVEGAILVASFWKLILEWFFMQHVYFNRKFEFLKEHQETTSGKTETEFEIEKILDKRGAGRTLQYFVKWKVSHQQGCPDCRP